MVRYLLLVPAAVLLALGGEGLYHVARSRQQVVLTCEEFVRSRPASLNVVIEGCEIDPAAVTYRVSGGRLRELFFPARFPRTPTTRPVPIIVATSERAVLDLAQPAVAAAAELSREQFRAAMQRALAAAGGPVISGTIRAGLLNRLLFAPDLSRIGTPLQPDAVVIDQHRAPNLLAPAGTFTAGLALLIPFFRPRRIRPRPEETHDRSAEAVAVRERLLTYTTSPAVPAIAPPSERPTMALELRDATGPAPAPGAEERAAPAALDVLKQPERIRFPAVMLLNLDTAATPAAIETAPPLGHRDEVTGRIRTAIPPVSIDSAGRLVTPPTDPDLVCDPGRHEIVHTLVVQANTQRGLDLLGELVVASGWRAFVPKLGRFVGPQELANRGLGNGD